MNLGRKHARAPQSHHLPTVLQGAFPTTYGIYFTTYVTDDDCRTLRTRCEEALAQHKRSLPGFPLCVYTTVRLDAEVTQAETLTRTFLQQYYGGGVQYHGLMGLGLASAVIDMLRRYEAAGVTDLCIRFVGTDQVAQLEQFIHAVVPVYTA